MTTEQSFENLYRKQCEKHEATYAKMNEFRKEAVNLRALLVDEQTALIFGRLVKAIFKRLSAWKPK